MNALFILLPIFGFSSIFHLLFKRMVSVSIFFSITFIISCLYVFGMFDLLKLGSYILFYSGILVLLSMFVMNTTKMIKLVSSVPFVMFFVASIIYLYFMKDAQFFFWDEYSHWGAFIKDMYYSDTFYGSNVHITHLNYPPGVSTWDYFIVKNTFFSDGNIYFGYFLILFSSTLMMYEKLSFKDIHWIIIIFIIQMILYASFGHWFSCIYVDHIIGAMFAGLMLAYLVDDFDVKYLVLFIFPLVGIVLVKEIGLFFGLAFLGFVLLDKIIKYRLDDNTLISSIKQNIRFLPLVIGLFVVMVLVLKSWGIRQESLGIKKDNQTMSKVVTNIISNKKILEPKVEDEVKKRFWHVVEYQQLHKEKVSLNYNEFSYGIMPKYKKVIKLSTVGVMVFYILIYFMVFLMLDSKKDKIYTGFVYGYMLFISVVYLFILYFSFLVAFGTDALRMPSYVRYMNMSVLPMLLVGFSLLISLYREKSKSIKAFFVVLVVISVFSFIVKPYFKPLYSQLSNNFRTLSDKITKPIVEKLPKGTKIFVIFPIRNNGSLNNILKFSLIPLKATISGYDFENKNFQDMLQIYSKYDYLWFVKLDNNLITKNKVFLRVDSSKKPILLYKINKNNNNLQIKPVQ